MELKPCSVDVSPLLDGEEMNIKTEDGIFSIGTKFDRVAVIKVENAIAAEDGIKETGHLADVFETETDQTRGIKAERVDVNSTENPSTEERTFSYASSSPVAESKVLIKNEEDIDMDDEGFQGINESNDRPSRKNEEHSECSERSNEPTTWYDQANGSSAWGLCEEAGSVSPSKVEENQHISEPERSTAYYWNNEFKLAHVSVKSSGIESDHTYHKQLSCTLCSAKLGHYGALKAHLETHTGEKPVSCTVCSAKFRYKCHLKNHRKTHSEKPFSCKICLAKFSQNSRLKCHVATRHSSERPFSCTMCSAKFRYECHLKNHVKTHGEKLFSCTMCPAKFTQKGSLKNHMTYSHRFTS